MLQYAYQQGKAMIVSEKHPWIYTDPVSSRHVNLRNQPSTLDPQPSTLNLQPSNRNPKPETRIPKPESRNLKAEGVPSEIVRLLLLFLLLLLLYHSQA